MSDAPPTLLVCLNRGATSMPILRDNGVFCVNTLRAGEELIADTFAGRTKIAREARFDTGQWSTLVTGSPALMSAVVATGEYTPLSPWQQNTRWRHVDLYGTVAPLPIRMVGEDEPWEQVVQDVQEHLRGSVSGRPVRVGFYGHGAFVTSAEVQYDTLFVAALGVAADMDVMVFPQWRFPEKNPLAELPWDILLGQLNNPNN